MPACTNGLCPMAAAGPSQAATSPAVSPPFIFQHQSDNCPSSHYCYIYGYFGLENRGHCCPKPPPKCPAGDPHPTASCAAGSPACPYNTHVCLNVGVVGTFGTADQICCPKPCVGMDKIYVQDQCLPSRHFGEECQFNEQCKQLNGICSGGKKKSRH